jgi:hypothetical protein
VVSEIVKLVLAAAIIVIAAAMIALFASGYISAFKPGGTKETAGEHVVGSSNTIGGGVSVVSTPVPSPSSQPCPVMPETVQMPPGPEPTMPPVQPIPPLPTPTMPEIPGTQTNPYMPVTQPSRIPTGPIEAPWPPVTQLPPSQVEKPGFTGPVSPLPGQGLLQMSEWLLRIVPVLFPGLFPGWTWWT